MPNLLCVSLQRVLLSSKIRLVGRLHKIEQTIGRGELGQKNRPILAFSFGDTNFVPREGVRKDITLSSFARLWKTPIPARSCALWLDLATICKTSMSKSPAGSCCFSADSASPQRPRSIDCHPEMETRGFVVRCNKFMRVELPEPVSSQQHRQYAVLPMATLPPVPC